MKKSDPLLSCTSPIIHDKLCMHTKYKDKCKHHLRGQRRYSTKINNFFGRCHPLKTYGIYYFQVSIEAMQSIRDDPKDQ